MAETPKTIEEAILPLLRSLAELVVIHPDQFGQEMEAYGNRVIITTRVPRGDKGRLIGKNGKVYKSLAVISSLIGNPLGQKVNLLNYNCEDFGARDMYNDSGKREDFPLSRCLEIAVKIISACVSIPEAVTSSIPKSSVDVISVTVASEEDDTMIEVLNESLQVFFDVFARRFNHSLILAISK